MPRLPALPLGCHDSAPEIRGLLDELDPQGSRVACFSLVQASLDDVFMALTDRRRDTTEKETSDV